MGELSLDRMDLPRKVYKDHKCICVECQEIFIFDVGTQLQFERLGFDEPKRCWKCRQLVRLLHDVIDEENEV